MFELSDKKVKWYAISIWYSRDVEGMSRGSREMETECPRLVASELGADLYFSDRVSHDWETGWERTKEEIKDGTYDPSFVTNKVEDFVDFGVCWETEDAAAVVYEEAWVGVGRTPELALKALMIARGGDENSSW